jgi:hypothetical protein
LRNWRESLQHQLNNRINRQFQLCVDAYETRVSQLISPHSTQKQASIRLRSRRC